MINVYPLTWDIKHVMYKFQTTCQVAVNEDIWSRLPQRLAQGPVMFSLNVINTTPAAEA